MTISTKSVKHLGVFVSWQYHANDLSIKLKRTNVLRFSIRKC